MTNSTDLNLTADHAGLTDTLAARRYFSKFDRITGHLTRIAATMHENGELTRTEVRVLTRYLKGLSGTFRALGTKYLFTGRDTGTFFGSLTVDRHESGFPVFQELLTMANDAQQAERHLREMPSEREMKEQMVKVITGDRIAPTKLQFALSQRLYYEDLVGQDMFWARMDPEALWTGDRSGRMRYLIHWATYDSQVNLPTIYLMDVEDSGKVSLPKDTRRWPQAQAHLMAQSVAGLKLLTIAQGFDQDFSDLHPKRLRRLHLGPMYSSAFTVQSGPIHEVLTEARAPEGEDWALAWTVEDLVSERTKTERAGWFGQVDREIFALDPFAGRGADTGASDTRRAVILPQRPYQVLAEKNPPGFGSVTKYVVNAAGRVFQA